MRVNGKPHIRKRHGIWTVSSRSVVHMLGSIELFSAAMQFCQLKNMESGI